MVTDVPDSAYELCSKYAPNCDDTSSAITSNKNSQSSSKKSKDKSKSKSSKKSRKNASSSDLSSSFANAQLERNLRISRQGFPVQESSVELENAGFGFNGEDDYYDSLNSGNEEGVFGPLNPAENPVPPYNPQFENNYPESSIPSYNPQYDNNNYNESYQENQNASNENVRFFFCIFENLFHYKLIDQNSSFTTIVNGVKMKSLPGPRGRKFSIIDKFDFFKLIFHVK